MWRGGYSLRIPTFGIAAPAGCAPQATVTSSQSQIPPIASGTARVWFLRGWDAPSGQGFVFAAAPVVFRQWFASRRYPYRQRLLP